MSRSNKCFFYYFEKASKILQHRGFYLENEMQIFIEAFTIQTDYLFEYETERENVERNRHSQSNFNLHLYYLFAFRLLILSRL